MIISILKLYSNQKCFSLLEIINIKSGSSCIHNENNTNFIHILLDFSSLCRHYGFSSLFIIFLCCFLLKIISLVLSHSGAFSLPVTSFCLDLWSWVFTVWPLLPLSDVSPLFLAGALSPPSVKRGERVHICSKCTQLHIIVILQQINYFICIMYGSMKLCVSQN